MYSMPCLKLKAVSGKFPTPINGTLFSTPLRGRKTLEIISNLLKGDKDKKHINNLFP
jgi:hypothetical protein